HGLPRRQRPVPQGQHVRHGPVCNRQPRGWRGRRPQLMTDFSSDGPEVRHRPTDLRATYYPLTKQVSDVDQLMRTRTEPLVSRRMVLAVKLLLIAVSATRGEDVRISSPDGRIQFDLVHAATGLEFQVHFKDRPVLDRSRMCFLLDEAILTRGVKLGKA